MKKKNIFLVKFTIVASMIGIFSPSVNVQPSVHSNNSFSLAPFQISVSLLNTVEARGRRGGGANRGGNTRARPAARPASRPAARPAKRPGNRPSTKPVNRNVNKNINVNKNVNVNVNNRYYGGHGHGYGYYGGRPILAFTTGLVIGSIIASASMPTTCTTVVASGISYRQCGSSYYQPFYQGDTLVYKVVSSPY